MTKKPDISKLYNYHNEEGVLLEMSSDYKLISRELKSINVDYEKTSYSRNYTRINRNKNTLLFGVLR
ncbi:hypothetical protein FPK15_contig00106-0001 [Flavobacterium psychrophilum]|uniref:hypothetical protein n=1 Tax=Flavobacterium psychrophilum TaxID=96345 RepID=UPI00073F72A2|nr:hypothetical protein [Flavobacterium psychrophilum]GAQ50119.1 hypothetical protein FPK15_contig00106-0001 [Flavobacterium psychrophilum]